MLKKIVFLIFELSQGLPPSTIGLTPFISPLLRSIKDTIISLPIYSSETMILLQSSISKTQTSSFHLWDLANRVLDQHMAVVAMACTKDVWKCKCLKLIKGCIKKLTGLWVEVGLIHVSFFPIQVALPRLLSHISECKQHEIMYKVI